MQSFTLRFVALAFPLWLASCGPATQTVNTAKTDSALGEVEIYDTAALRSIDSNATITAVGHGYDWTEGPLWVSSEHTLLFSDVPQNKIYAWREDDSLPRLWLTPSGYTGKAPRAGEIGSNGLALDANGKLLLCQCGNRQIARMNASLGHPRPDHTALATNYEGKKLNSPNDIIADSHNNIYFTDPIYGLPQREKDPTRELPFEGVYRVNTGGKLELLIDSIPRANGIALSPDEKTLYIASSDDLKPAWYAYKLDAQGKIEGGGVLLDARPLKAKAKKGAPDGVKIDRYGNIFSGGPDGINIISPAGKLLALIRIYNRPASNCSFNETKEVLYVTADDLVLKVSLRPR